MAEYFETVRESKVMLAMKCLISSFIVFLLIDQSCAYNVERVYGDVNNDELAIDHLGLRAQDGREFNSEFPHSIESNFEHAYYDQDVPNLYSALKIDKKIEFGVDPQDPRYFLPSSVLRQAHGESRERQIENGEGLPAEENIRKSAAFLVGDPSQPPPHESPLLRELYNRYWHLLSGQEEVGHDVGPLYKGHKFGPNAPKDDDSKISPTESVNFLQSSRHQAEIPQFYMHNSDRSAVLSDFYFVALVSGCTAAAVCTVVGAGICYFRLHKNKRDAADTVYPAYGVTGPCKDFSPGVADRKLAQSAHMFHYQHQKQQMIALEKSSGDERHCSTSDVDSEEEGEEGDYTVYECPGLAPTGEMEVKNPLFSDDPTPATPGRPKGTNDTKKDDDDDDEENIDNK